MATRKVPGHSAGDRIKGDRTHGASGWMDGTDARSARAGFTKTLRHVPAQLRKTLTDDRGTEMAEHERVAERLAIQIVCADP